MKVLREITPEVERLLKAKNFASFATIMADGSPQVTPVWVDYDGKNILINTVEGRIKLKNVDQNPNVAISVIDSENPYTMVAVRGRVIERSSHGADEHIDKMAKKYLGVEKYPFRAPGEKRILLKMKPGPVTFMSP